MSAIARQRSDSSPQKTKAHHQPSFADAAEGESRLEEERRRREEEAAKKREDRRRLDELQRAKDEEDAEEAARRIVNAGSRIALIKLEEQQLLRQQLSSSEVPQSRLSPLPPTPSPVPPLQQQQEDAAVTPNARADPSSPVKKYLRNELRCKPLPVMQSHVLNS
jgi:hypothetical protein